MSTTCIPGKYVGVLCDGFDVQRLLNSARTSMARDDTDTTTFGQGDKSNISTLRGGTLSSEGFYLGNSGAYYKLLHEAIGPEDTLHYMAYCPEGYAVGKQAIVFKSNQNAYEVGAPYSGAVMTSITWGATGGLRLGTILNTHAGATITTIGEVQVLTFNAADINQFYALRAVGTTEVFNFQPSAVNSAIKAGVEGLAAYAGFTVTVSGSTTGTDTRTGSKTIAFSGTTDVPQLEVITGTVNHYVVTGGGNGNYKWDGGANFTLGINEADLQTNQRALAGAHSNVVVKGTSSAGGAGTITNGGTPICSSDNSSQGGATAFDANSATPWVPNEPGNDGTAWIGYDRGAGREIVSTAYRIHTYDQNPAHNELFDSWVFEGSQNLTTWTTLDTVTSHSPLADGTDYDFSFTNTTAYRAYRLRITGTRAGQPILGDLYIYSGSAPGSANFYSYFPVGVSPSATTATGTGAVASNVFAASSNPSTLVGTTTEQGGVSSVGYNIVSTTGNGASVDNALQSNIGAVAHLHAVYSQGSGKTLTVKIQHSTDGSTWSDLITFAPITTSGNTGILRATLPKGTVVKRYTRSVVVAVTGNWAFTVILSPQGPDI